MPKVTFTENREVKDAAGKVVQSYEAGKTYDMTDDIAYRWIRRQVAYEATEKPKAPKPKPKEEPKEEEDKTTFAKRKPPVTKV